MKLCSACKSLDLCWFLVMVVRVGGFTDIEGTRNNSYVLLDGKEWLAIVRRLATFWRRKVSMMWSALITLVVADFFAYLIHRPQAIFTQATCRNRKFMFLLCSNILCRVFFVKLLTWKYQQYRLSFFWRCCCWSILCALELDVLLSRMHCGKAQECDELTW